MRSTQECQVGQPGRSAFDPPDQVMPITPDRRPGAFWPGLVRLDGLLDAEGGATLRTALQPFMKPDCFVCSVP